MTGSNARLSVWLVAIARTIVVAALFFAAPGAAELVEQVGSLEHTPCTDEGSCDDDGGACCPLACAHCSCCSRLHAVTTTVSITPAPPLPIGWPVASYLERAYAPGFRSPPFRPPAA